MDGNRRYARQAHLATAQGHECGFAKLKQTLEWCEVVGVRTVTVYAFSVENFNRPRKEVSALMDLARDKFVQLLAKGDVVEQYNARVRVLGDLERLPEDVAQLAKKLMRESDREAPSLTLNICFSYSSEQEMADAAAVEAQGVASGRLEPDDVTADVFAKCLYTGDGSAEVHEPDLLVRTSGEMRLSDFLLWQTSRTHFEFVDVLWPEFSCWDFLLVLLRYQRNREDVVSVEENKRVDVVVGGEEDGERAVRIRRFLDSVRAERMGTAAVVKNES